MNIKSNYPRYYGYWTPHRISVLRTIASQHCYQQWRSIATVFNMLNQTTFSANAVRNALKYYASAEME